MSILVRNFTIANSHVPDMFQNRLKIAKIVVLGLKGKYELTGHIFM